MKTGNDLYHLIQSLSPTEKAGFLRQYDARKTGLHKAQLFRAMEAQAGYQAAPLVQALQQVGWRGQLATAKFRLKAEILDFLSEGAIGQMPDFKLRRQLDHIALLLEKGLPRQALNETRKAKKQARALDASTVLLELLQTEGRLVRNLGGADLNKTLSALNDESARILQLMQEEHLLAQHYDTLFIKIREKTDVRSPQFGQWLASLAEQVANIPIQPGHFQNKRIQLHFLAFYYQLTARNEDGFALLKDIVSLWQAWPQRISAEPEGYLKSCRGLLEAATLHDDWKVYSELRGALDNFRPPTDKLRAKLAYILLHTDLNHALSQFSFSALENLEQRFTKHQKKYPHNQEISYNIALQFNFFNACFLDGNYVKANYWRRQMEVEGYNAERKDIKDFARIAEILVTFERKAPGNFENSLRNHRRFFEKQASEYPLEIGFLQWMRNIYLEKGFLLNSADISQMTTLLHDYEKLHQSLPLGWQLVRWWLERPRVRS